MVAYWPQLGRPDDRLITGNCKLDVPILSSAFRVNFTKLKTSVAHADTHPGS